MMRNQMFYRRGISMAETIILTLLVGFVIASTLQIVGPMVRSSSVLADNMIAANLANEMAEEISTKLFTDPDVDSGDAIGVDIGERSAVRMDFDDVDDYNAWNESPPQTRSGVLYTSLDGWSRKVKVVHVEPGDLSKGQATLSGIKKITIFIKKNGVLLKYHKSYHTRSADQLGFVVPKGSSP